MLAALPAHSLTNLELGFTQSCAAGRPAATEAAARSAAGSSASLNALPAALVRLTYNS
jgi:hypothetical protein